MCFGALSSVCCVVSELLILFFMSTLLCVDDSHSLARRGDIAFITKLRTRSGTTSRTLCATRKRPFQPARLSPHFPIPAGTNNYGSPSPKRENLGTWGKFGDLRKIWGVGENLGTWGKSEDLGKIWGLGENLGTWGKSGDLGRNFGESRGGAQILEKIRGFLFFAYLFLVWVWSFP